MLTLFRVILSICLPLSLAYSIIPNQAHSLPPPTIIEKINGFEVHFVDIGRGTSFATTFYVPFGTLNSGGSRLGDLHFLEHLLFTGNNDLPGHESFSKKVAQVGAQYNAYTSTTFTFYYTKGEMAHARALINAQFSMFSGLELNPQVFKREREVVVNEIAVENNKKDPYALHYMGLSKILPHNHPWAHPMLGDTTSLRALDPDYMNSLYETLYHPSNIKIAIIGNFSDKNVAAKIRRWTRAALEKYDFKNQPDPNILRAFRETPSLIGASQIDAPKRLEITSKSTKNGEILLEVHTPTQASKAALHVLSSYLSLDAPNSLIDRLKRQPELITGAGVYPINFDKVSHLNFYYTPTDLGSKDADKIRTDFFSALTAIAKYGPDPTALRLAIESLKLRLEKASRSVAGLVNVYDEVLAQSGDLATALDDLDHVTPADVQKLAQLMEPNQAILLDIGDFQGEGMAHDPVFDRSYRLVDYREGVLNINRQRGTVSSQDFSPQLEPVTLPVMGKPSTMPLLAQSDSDDVGDEWVMDLRNDLPDTYIGIKFLYAPRTPIEIAAVDVFLTAFNTHYRSEFSTLSLVNHISLSLSSDGSQIYLNAQGEDAQSAAAIQWALHQLKDFTPSAEELKQAIELLKTGELNSYLSAWSYEPALKALNSSFDLNALPPLEFRNLLENLSSDKVVPVWTRLIQHADILQVGVGAFNKHDFSRTLEVARELSPNPLRPSIREKLRSQYQWDESSIQSITRPFPLVKNPDAYGLARTYRGPKLHDHREKAAFAALGSTMGDLIDELNRSHKQLGYVHGAFARSVNLTYSHLYMIGQTEGAEQARSTIDGWEEIIGRLRDGKISDEELWSGISAYRTGVEKELTSASEIAARYAIYRDLYHDITAFELTKVAAQSLAPEDIRKVGKKYLLKDSTVYSEVIMGDCEKFLLEN